MANKSAKYGIKIWDQMKSLVAFEHCNQIYFLHKRHDIFITKKNQIVQKDHNCTLYHVK